MNTAPIELTPLNDKVPRRTVTILAEKYNLNPNIIVRILRGEKQQYIHIYNEAAEIAINHNRALNEARELSKQLQ